MVDGYSVPAGTTTYDYLDVFFSAALGSLDVAGTSLSLANGQSGTISGTITARSAPAEGRELFGEMKVVSPEGATLGTGAVRVLKVN